MTKLKLTPKQVKRIEQQLIRNQRELDRAGEMMRRLQLGLPLHPPPLRPKRLVAAKPQEVVPIGPQDVDVESRGTFDTSARGRAHGGHHGMRVEPAWFVPREKSPVRISRRLLSDSSPPATESNTKTFRLAAIADWSTGSVFLVSVWANNAETRVTRFTNGFSRAWQRAKSVSLREVLSQRMADGRLRFEVIGSVRTKALTEYHLQKFCSRREFRERFAKPVMDAQRAVQSGARATQVRMEAFGLECGTSWGVNVGEEIERAQEDVTSAADDEDQPAPEDLPDEDPAPDFDRVAIEAYSHETDRARPVSLTSRDCWLLREWMPSFSTVDELVDLLSAHHPDGQPVIGDELYEVIEKVTAQDVSFFTLAEDAGIEQTLKAYGY